MNFFDYAMTCDSYRLFLKHMKILADEKRFSQFGKQDKAKLTKKLKRLEYFKNADITYMNAEELAFINTDLNKNEIHMTKGSSWCEDLFKHIRNSIFHGRAEVMKKKSTTHFVFKDYGKKGNPSAYICLTENNFGNIFKCYQEAVNQIKNTKSYANKEYKKENAS